MARYVHDPACPLEGNPPRGTHCACATLPPPTVTKRLTAMMRLRVPRELWDRYEEARAEVRRTRVAHDVARERLKLVRDEMQAAAEIHLGPEEDDA